MNEVKLDEILDCMQSTDLGELKWALARAYALGVEDSREAVKTILEDEPAFSGLALDLEFGLAQLTKI